MLRNQDDAVAHNATQAALEPQEAPQPTTRDEPIAAAETAPADDLPDFGKLVHPFALRDYPQLVR